MSFSEWKKALRANLDDMKDDEVDAAIDYYKEMFADMSDAGKSETDILAEFGTPAECASKIRIEQSESADFDKKSDISTHTVLNSEEKNDTSRRKEESTPSQKKQTDRRTSIGGIIGMFLFSLIIILPLAGVALGIVVSFASVAVSGVAISVSGALLVVASPAVFILQYGIGEMLLCIGGGITLIGVGIILAIAFWCLTKLSVKGTMAFFRLIYRRF